ncbi:hypothetical protein D3C73_542110 [compost metagenome]
MTKPAAALTIQYRKKGEGHLELARIFAAVGQSHYASYHGAAGGGYFAESGQFAVVCMGTFFGIRSDYLRGARDFLFHALFVCGRCGVGVVQSGRTGGNGGARGDVYLRPDSFQHGGRGGTACNTNRNYPRNCRRCGA